MRSPSSSAYEDPDNVPAEHRQPYVRDGGLHPHSDGIVPGALPMWASAERAGGPRNGVLTAAEDFVAAHDGLRLVTAAPFFGLGVIWHEDAAYGDRLADYLSWWAGNPIVERLEANRVLQICTAHMQASTSDEWQRRDDRKAVLIEELLGSTAFKLALRLLRIRHPGKELPFSEDRLRSLLAESRSAPASADGPRSPREAAASDAS